MCKIHKWFITIQFYTNANNTTTLMSGTLHKSMSACWHQLINIKYIVRINHLNEKQLGDHTPLKSQQTFVWRTHYHRDSKIIIHKQFASQREEMNHGKHSNKQMQVARPKFTRFAQPRTSGIIHMTEHFPAAKPKNPGEIIGITTKAKCKSTRRQLFKNAQLLAKRKNVETT